MNKLLLLLLLLLFTNAAIPENYENFQKIEKEFNILLCKIGYVEDSKSIKGWLRIFNSKEKLNDYEIYIPEEKRIKIIKLLLYKEKINKTKNHRIINYKKIINYKINNLRTCSVLNLDLDHSNPSTQIEKNK